MRILLIFDWVNLNFPSVCKIRKEGRSHENHSNVVLLAGLLFGQFSGTLRSKSGCGRYTNINLRNFAFHHSYVRTGYGHTYERSATGYKYHRSNSDCHTGSIAFQHIYSNSGYGHTHKRSAAGYKYHRSKPDCHIKIANQCTDLRAGYRYACGRCAYGNAAGQTNQSDDYPSRHSIGVCWRYMHFSNQQ